MGPPARNFQYLQRQSGRYDRLDANTVTIGSHADVATSGKTPAVADERSRHVLHGSPFVFVQLKAPPPKFTHNLATP